MTLDEEITTNRKFVRWMMATYLWYVDHLMVLSNKEWEELTLEMYERWDEITHSHKRIVAHEDLAEGTGKHITEWPTILVASARQWYREEQQRAADAVTQQYERERISRQQNNKHFISEWNIPSDKLCGCGELVICQCGANGGLK